MPHKFLVGNLVTDISAGSWEEYLGRLSRNRRRLTRKKMRQLERDHGVEVELIDDEPGYLSHFERIREIQRLRATKDRLDRSDAYYACVRETNSHLFRNGEMALCLLKAGGTVIAYRLGLTRGSTFYDWNTNYDIKWSAYSPGLISLSYVIRELISSGYTAVDFMAGVYDYKLSFSPMHEMRSNHLFVMGNGSLRSMIFLKYQLEWRDRIKPHYRKVVDVISKTGSHFQRWSRNF